jgi:hypothetical protein
MTQIRFVNPRQRNERETTMKVGDGGQQFQLIDQCAV